MKTKHKNDNKTKFTCASCVACILEGAFLYFQLTKMTGIWVDDILIERISVHSDTFKWLTAKMSNSIHTGASVTGYEIVEAFRILNKDTWPNYTNTRTKLFNENNRQMVEEKRLFHASPQARAIGQKGFDLSLARSSGLFGAGVYFAENSSKSNDYAFGLGNGCSKHGDGKCTQCVRTILVCKVALGKIYQTKNCLNGLPKGYHSLHFTGGVAEFVVYNDKQAYPSYIINYKAKY